MCEKTPVNIENKKIFIFYIKIKKKLKLEAIHTIEHDVYG